MRKHLWPGKKKDWAGKVENSSVSPGTSAVSELYWHEESESKHLEEGVRGRGSGRAGVVAGTELAESGMRACSLASHLERGIRAYVKWEVLPGGGSCPV